MCEDHLGFNYTTQFIKGQKILEGHSRCYNKSIYAVAYTVRPQRKRMEENLGLQPFMVDRNPRGLPWTIPLQVPPSLDSREQASG